ncbi:MAG: hypothetical protein WCV70_04395 [Patescibacteria group bacterium]|jgi:hypothetical protein
MSDINFLDNKKNGDDQEPKDKGDKKERIAWSNPRKEAKSSKGSFFSFWPSLNKKKPINKISAAVVDKNNIVDKNKIKKSREEILNLIKHHEYSKPPAKEKDKNFLEIFSEKFKKKLKPKEVLIDYQRAFNREKEHKDQLGKIFNIKPAVEGKLEPKLPGKSKDNWFDRLIESLKRKIIALSARKNEIAKIVKSPKAEEIKPAEVKPLAPARPFIQEEKKPAEVKEINIKENEPVHKNEVRQRVLETNLIQGELVNFFDWRSKVAISLSAILAPIFIVGAVYYGLAFYQKSNQAKNLAQAEKFAQLEQDIGKEESSIKEILDFQSRLKIVTQIFKQHLYWTNFFNFLEDNMIKDVYFKNFSGDTGGNYTMNATAVNYSNIPEQISVLKNNKKITSVEANGGDLATGDDKNESSVKFNLKFSVSKNIFTE